MTDVPVSPRVSTVGVYRPSKRLGATGGIDLHDSDFESDDDDDDDNDNEDEQVDSDHSEGWPDDDIDMDVGGVNLEGVDTGGLEEDAFWGVLVESMNDNLTHKPRHIPSNVLEPPTFAVWFMFDLYIFITGQKIGKICMCVILLVSHLVVNRPYKKVQTG